MSKTLAERIGMLPKRVDHSHDGPAEFVLLSEVMREIAKRPPAFDLIDLLDYTAKNSDTPRLDWLESNSDRVMPAEKKGEWVWMDRFGAEAVADDLRTAIDLAKAST